MARALATLQETDGSVTDGCRRLFLAVLANALRDDAVTHSGALWIATRDATDGEAPGASGAWQLAVKQGAVT